MSDRLTRIRAHIASWKAQKAVGTEGYRDGLKAFEAQATEDIEWLISEVERLEKRVRMYEVVKS